MVRPISRGRKSMKSFSILILVFAGGCATSKAAQLKTQAATDFQCGEEQLSTKGVVPWVERVSGCGKDNVYYWEHSGRKWVSPLDVAAFEMSCTKESMKTTPLT